MPIRVNLGSDAYKIVIAGALAGEEAAWAALRAATSGLDDLVSSCPVPLSIEDIWGELRYPHGPLPDTSGDLAFLIRVVAEDVAAWVLLDAYRRGVKSALPAIHRIFDPWLRGVVRSVMGPHPDCADVVQDVWKSLLEKPPARLPPQQRKSKTPFRNYLRTAARRNAWKRLGGAGFLGPLPEGPDEPTSPEPPPDQPTADPAKPVRADPVKMEGLRVTARLTQAPHQTIAYMLNKWLGESPTDIANTYASSQLRQVLEMLPDMLSQHEMWQGMVSPEAWRDILEPLRAVMGRPVAGLITEPEVIATYHGDPDAAVGDSRMSDYLPPACDVWPAVIGHWVNATQRRFRAAVNAQEETVLSCVTGSPRPPHEIIAFGLSCMLRDTPGSLALRSHHLLGILAEDWASRYKADARKRRGLADARIDACMANLRKRLDRLLSLYITIPARRRECSERKARVTGDTCFHDYYRSDRQTAEILRWIRAVRWELIVCLRSLEGLLFAYKRELLIPEEGA